MPAAFVRQETSVLQTGNPRPNILSRVGVRGILPERLEASGTVVNVRLDCRGMAIYTVQLDDESLTSGGLFVAREFELTTL
jgi:hypothetical protein